MPRYAAWWLVFLCLIYTAISPVLAGFEKFCVTDQKSHKDGLCGDQLSEIIKLVCGGKFSLPNKRLANQDNNIEDMFPKFTPLQEAIMGKRNALSYLGTNKRYYNYGRSYQGIVCECCYNSCDWNELQQYCLFEKKSLLQ